MAKRKVVRFKLEGTEQLRRTVKRIGARAEKALENALYEEGERIMGQAKEITPVDTGALRASGHVPKPKRLGVLTQVILSFGGIAAGTYKSKRTKRIVAEGERIGYAQYVHENLGAHHPVGRAKYLEEPFKRAQAGLIDRLARRVRIELGG